MKLLDGVTNDDCGDCFDARDAVIAFIRRLTGWTPVPPCLTPRAPSESDLHPGCAVALDGVIWLVAQDTDHDTGDPLLFHVAVPAVVNLGAGS